MTYLAAFLMESAIVMWFGCLNWIWFEKVLEWKFDLRVWMRRRIEQEE